MPAIAKETGIKIVRVNRVLRVDILDPQIVGEQLVMRLRRAIEMIMTKDAAAKIVINLERVEHMSSAALGELVGAKKKLDRGGGQVRICQPSPEVSEIFAITRLNKVIPIFDDFEAAAASLR